MTFGMGCPFLRGLTIFQFNYEKHAAKFNALIFQSLNFNIAMAMLGPRL